MFSLFHRWTYPLSLSLSPSLSMQSPIDREICRSCIMEIVPFLCLYCFTDGHSLSLMLYLSFSLSLHAISVPTVPASPQYTPTPQMAPTPPRSPQCPWCPYTPLVPEYLEFLLAPQYTPTPLMPQTAPYTPRSPQCLLYPFWSLST